MCSLPIRFTTGKLSSDDSLYKAPAIATRPTNRAQNLSSRLQYYSLSHTQILFFLLSFILEMLDDNMSEYFFFPHLNNNSFTFLLVVQPKRIFIPIYQSRQCQQTRQKKGKINLISYSVSQIQRPEKGKEKNSQQMKSRRNFVLQGM